jgi:hypothetical protein
MMECITHTQSLIKLPATTQLAGVSGNHLPDHYTPSNLFLVILNYLTVNGLHYVSKGLLSIHQLSNQPERKIMCNVISGGGKLHLKQYKGAAINKKGKVVFQVSAGGDARKSCGGKYKGALSMLEFATSKAISEGSVCSKCLLRFNSIVSERDILNKI